MTKVYVGDTGTQVVLNTGAAVAGAASLQILVRKPDGSEVTWNATPDGSQSMTYTTDSDDLNLPGTYLLQAKITTPSGGAWLGQTARLRVYDRFR